MSKQQKKKNIPSLSTTITEIRRLMKNKKFIKCEELILKEFKSERISMDILIEKIRLEMALGKHKKALRSCKLGLFLQPANLELHKVKL